MVHISVTRVINYIQTADDDDNDNEHFIYIYIGYFVIILRRWKIVITLGNY